MVSLTQNQIQKPYFEFLQMQTCFCPIQGDTEVVVVVGFRLTSHFFLKQDQILSDKNSWGPFISNLIIKVSSLRVSDVQSYPSQTGLWMILWSCPYAIFLPHMYLKGANPIWLTILFPTLCSPGFQGKSPEMRPEPVDLTHTAMFV